MQTHNDYRTINSDLLAGIYKTDVGKPAKKGGIKLDGMYAISEIKEKPVLTVCNASGRNIFSIVKDAN